MQVLLGFQVTLTEPVAHNPKNKHGQCAHGIAGCDKLKTKNVLELITKLGVGITSSSYVSTPFGRCKEIRIFVKFLWKDGDCYVTTLGRVGYVRSCSH